MMAGFFRRIRRPSDAQKALLFNAGSLLDDVALYFLISTAVEKSFQHRVPTLNEYAFIAVTLFSWLLSMPYEWALRWERYEAIVYVLSMILILCIYLSIGIA